MTQKLVGYSSIAILGMGATGLSVARFFRSRGIDFMFADTRCEPPGLGRVRREYPNVRVMLGELDGAAYDALEILVVSPGVALDEPILQRALANNIRLIGDVELFFQHANAPVVAITGANGKSTVTTLVGEMARRSGLDVGVGGNLGTPMLDLLSAERQLYVLELSSFQLELFQCSEGATCALLNISPDHLDRYRDIDHYRAAKLRIFRGAQHAIVNRQDPLTYPESSERTSITSFGSDQPNGEHFGLQTYLGETWLVGNGERLMRLTSVAMQGRHNINNALAALALGGCAELPMSAMIETLCDFEGLPHRCEKIASIEGVLYIDDSKATNVGATCAAIDGFAHGRQKNILLIAGGYAKGQDFDALVSRASGAVKHCLLIGEASIELSELFEGRVTTQHCDSLNAAVACAYRIAKQGDVVLLSPACASFDMFADFADRGRCFQAAVRALKTTTPPTMVAL